VKFFDYDNDGWPDIFMANGTSMRKLKDKPLAWDTPNGHSYFTILAIKIKSGI